MTPHQAALSNYHSPFVDALTNRPFSTHVLRASTRTTLAPVAAMNQRDEGSDAGRNEPLHPVTPLKSGRASVAEAPPSHPNEAVTDAAACWKNNARYSDS
jgi:hypothetical protein